MTKKQLRKLAEQSYKILDEEKAQQISSLLNRKDLKEFIRQLKFVEKQHEVIIALPNINSYNKSDNFFDTLFAGKKVIYQEDRSLLLGAKITDNDIVYDINLKSTLEETANYIQEDYE